MASEAELLVNIETALPSRLTTGQATAVFCYGSCTHPRREPRRLELLVDGEPQRVAAQRMPRPELDDRRSGFWTTVRVGARERPAAIAIAARAELGDGGAASASVGTIEAVDPPAPAVPSLPAGAIAVCMATFEPDPRLFRDQVESLRAQSDRNWICLVSDDCSRQERFEQIEALLAGDERFVLSRSRERLGFYRNFERALGMVPDEAELVALCDHDDRWHPDKLASLRAAIGEAELVYSDARLVDPEGAVLAETMWEGRRNNHTSLASMLITNTVTGAASLFRRRLLDLALPFPEGPGWQFHDHWLAVAALASGDVAYVDRPLYDYVQHRDAVLRGLVAGEEPENARSRLRPPGRQGLRELAERWRARYFYGYVPLQLRAIVLLSRRPAGLSARKSRALRRLAEAERSPLAFAWLSARRLRRLAGRGETHGAEGVLATGILWRRIVGLAAAAGQARRSVFTTAMPPFDPDRLAPRRWRRRQARFARARLAAGGPTGDG